MNEPTHTQPERFTFRVAGTPRPKSRPRVHDRNGRPVVWNGGSDKEKLWAAAVERECRVAVERLGGGPLYRGAVRVTILYSFVMPESRKYNPRGRRLGDMHTNRPDKDNLDKLMFDVMQKCGVFADDCQIADGGSKKVWSEKASAAVLVEAVGVQERVEPDIRHIAAPDWLTRS